MLTNCADPREKWTSGQNIHPTTDVLCLFSPLPPQHQQHLQPARSPQQELGQSQALPPSNASISFFYLHHAPEQFLSHPNSLLPGKRAAIQQLVVRPITTYSIGNGFNSDHGGITRAESRWRAGWHPEACSHSEAICSYQQPDLWTLPLLLPQL